MDDLVTPDITPGQSITLTGQFADITKAKLTQEVLDALGNLSAAIDMQEDGQGNVVPPTSGETALSRELGPDSVLQAQLTLWLQAFVAQG